MDEKVKEALAGLRRDQERLLAELEEFLRIPSISTESARAADTARAAEWLAARLRRLGLPRVEILPTGGYPVVFADTGAASAPGRPRVLIYGHYDVQPVDPLELWESDPFDPARRGDRLFARGASDMKGQIMAALGAAEALLAVSPGAVELKFLFEGEEEIGSPHLPGFLRDNRGLLEAELCLNPDAGMLGPELPTVTYALRGLAYFELRLRGPERDLHSGAFGGTVHNPAQVLCELIAGLHDDAGRVTLPGFYDRVRGLDPREREALGRLPQDAEFFRRTAGVETLWGEEGFSPVERVGARPTLEVNGLLSGFTGKGSKTVLPAAAMAKLSTRLVPDQSPEEVAAQLRAYLQEHAPATVRWELEQLAGGPPWLGDTSSRWTQALARAMEAVWGKPPLFRREGGSVPVAAYLWELAGTESLLTGFALPDDNAHSPNEHLHLPTWQRGTECLLRFLIDLTKTDVRGGYA